MPYDDYGRWAESKTNLTTDTLSFGEIGGIGGVGQLIYKMFRFKKYELRYVDSGEILACPICRSGFEPEFFDSDDMTGTEILVSLYNLALKINDLSEEKPYDELIVEWCNEVAHPYFVDEISALMGEDEFDLSDDSFLIERDGIFDVKEFMRDLENFYQVVAFSFALDMMEKGNDDKAFDLAKEGRYFEGLPFLEKYKIDSPEEGHENKNYSAITPKELLKEMQESKQNHSPIYINSQEEGFARVPFDDYEELRDKLIDMMPDFRMRLKVNRKKNRVVIAADIHSVFDIAWYTLAKKICEDPLPKLKKKLAELDSNERPVVLTCPICGKAFLRKGKAVKKKYCGSYECNKIRLAQNTRNCRKRQKIAEMQTSTADNE